MPSHRLLAALAMVFSLGSAVSAGPIPWSYSSTFTNATDPALPFAYIGEVGHGAGGLYNAAAELMGQSEAAGSGVVTAGQAFRRYYFAGTKSPPTWDRDFALTMTMTDANSGQSEQFTFNGYFTQRGDIGPMSARNTNSWEQSAVIGGNRYDVTLLYPNSADDLTLTAAVTVEPVVPTPEPTPLALAAIGLAGAGVWWARGLRGRRVTATAA